MWGIHQETVNPFLSWGQRDCPQARGPGEQTLRPGSCVPGWPYRKQSETTPQLVLQEITNSNGHHWFQKAQEEKFSYLDSLNPMIFQL